MQRRPLVLALLSASLLLLALALQPAAPALAGPAAPVTVTLRQPDGTTFRAVPYGDERNNGYETLDGYTVVKNRSTGYWHYAVPDSAGKLAAGPLVASKDQPGDLKKHARPVPSAMKSAPRRAGPSATSGRAGASVAVTGTQKVLVLLAQFSDRAPVGSTPEQWKDTFFGTGNSLKNYYSEASYNQFTFVPAEESYGTANDGVVGWLNLGYPHPNTAGDVDARNQQIVKDAIIAADPYVNFAPFDTNGDGYISANELHILVIVAGYETAYGGAEGACSPGIWAHSWALGESDGINPPVTAPTADGKIIQDASHGGGYTQLGEWHCSNYDNPGHRATMGTVAHELGHDIGWPDLYDTSGVSEGVGEWSVMGSGNWLSAPGGYVGSSPAHPDAFLKWYQGWITPTQVIGTQNNVPVVQAESPGATFVQLLNNPGGVDWRFGQQSGSGEYFLMENREKTGFDAGLPGCGLLIWHIDESVTYSNAANAGTAHPLVDLMEADGRVDLHEARNRGDTGDPFPGARGSTTFDRYTNPNSDLYNGSHSGVYATNISGSCAVTMTANFSAADARPTPTPTPPPVLNGQPDLVPYAPVAIGGLWDQPWQYPLVPSSVKRTNGEGILYAGQPTYMDMALLNQGNGSTSGTFYTCIYLDGTEIFRGAYGSALPQNYFVYWQDLIYTVSSPGQHTLRMTADCTGAASESSEGNNSWEKQFTWLPDPGWRPDLIPYKPSGWDFPLVPSSVTGTTTLSTLYAGQPAYIDWAVRNTGSGDAAGPDSGTVYYCIYLDGNSIGTWSATGLEASYWVYVPDWAYTVPSPGYHTLKLTADCTNVTTDSNRGNNSWERQFFWNEFVVRGHVGLQSRPTPPDASYGITATLSILQAGTETQAYSTTVSTDQSGYFTTTAMVVTGTYDLRVKGTHTLSRKVTGKSLVNGSNTIDWATAGDLKEGDADGSNQVTILDFSILRATFGKQLSDAGFDPRADFDQDTVITIRDFSLLRTNFNQSGE